MRPKTFTFQGQEYEYWRNDPGERIIEIPIFWNIITKYQPAETLEIGNVLGHYYPVKHTVVDKYEKTAGVINEDAVSYQPDKQYSLIISVSTLEHIGTLMDMPKDQAKIRKTITHLKALLAPGGKLVISLPLGFNLIMDARIRKGTIKFDRRYCMKRISADNEWVETTWEDIKDAKYNKPFPAANGLIIGETDG